MSAGPPAPLQRVTQALGKRAEAGWVPSLWDTVSLSLCSVHTPGLVLLSPVRPGQDASSSSPEGASRPLEGTGGRVEGDGPQSLGLEPPTGRPQAGHSAPRARLTITHS